jgi:hypothetical protein
MGTIGIEWVEKYNGLQGDLSNTKEQAEGFYNTLNATRSFNWGDDLAWDQDFEESGRGSPSAGSHGREKPPASWRSVSRSGQRPSMPDCG